VSVDDAPLRVLWVTKGLGRGGAEHLLVLLARAVRSDDPDIELDVVYALAHKTALVDDLRAAGARVRLLGGGRAGWPIALVRAIRSGGYDVIHTHSPVPAAVARLANAGRRRPSVLVHTEHSAWDRYRLPTRAVNALTYRSNAIVFAVSDAVARSIRARPGRPPVEVLHHGVDLARAQRGPLARAQARRRLGCDPDVPLVGTVGSLTPKKDHGTLIAAFASVVASHPTARLVLVGAGPEEPRLRAQIDRAGLADRVHLLGVRDDVPDLLPGLDVFVLASKHEGLGLALVEAMASEVACIGTHVGGIPEVVHDGVDGQLVPAGDPQRLADAIDELLRDPVRRHGLAAAAAASAARFSIDGAAQRTLRAYRAVARDR
jgi:glycosyltransferase involved in cell wall biosynthesis